MHTRDLAQTYQGNWKDRQYRRGERRYQSLSCTTLYVFCALTSAIYVTTDLLMLAFRLRRLRHQLVSDKETFS